MKVIEINLRRDVPVPMTENRRNDCNWCGLRRVCFPGRLRADPRIGPGPLGIRRVHVARGRAVYRAGERLDAFHMVRSGCIMETERAGALDSILEFRLPGELLTVQGPAGTRSRITGLAVEPSFVCALPWRVFYGVCAKFPAVTGEFVQVLAKSAAGTRELLSAVRDKGALARVAAFLASLGARMQSRGLPADEVRLSMGRAQIAGYLGLRSETVSRCFSELERRGIVAVRAKRIRVLSAERMRRLAQVDRSPAEPPRPAAPDA